MKAGVCGNTSFNCVGLVDLEQLDDFKGKEALRIGVSLLSLRNCSFITVGVGLNCGVWWEERGVESFDKFVLPSFLESIYYYKEEEKKKLVNEFCIPFSLKEMGQFVGRIFDK